MHNHYNSYKSEGALQVTDSITEVLFKERTKELGNNVTLKYISIYQHIILHATKVTEVQYVKGQGCPMRQRSRTSNATKVMDIYHHRETHKHAYGADMIVTLHGRSSGTKVITTLVIPTRIGIVLPTQGSWSGRIQTMNSSSANQHRNKQHLKLLGHLCPHWKDERPILTGGATSLPSRMLSIVRFTDRVAPRSSTMVASGMLGKTACTCLAWNKNRTIVKQWLI